MIIARSPLRITLGGGGTDLASYYRDHEGFVVAAAIDKYIYVTIHQTFVEELIVKYSQMERVQRVEDLRHPLFREALRLMAIDGRFLEISSMADIPAGTGLGSSGSFATSLLRALHHHTRLPTTGPALAEMACKVEIDILKEPVGKQDQYISALGGVTSFHFMRDDSVQAAALPLSEEVLHNLEDNLLLFFTGYVRSAGKVLSDQDKRSRDGDAEMVDNLHYVKDLGLRSAAAMREGRLHDFGLLMHEHWQHKKNRSNAISNPQIDQWYEIGMRNGAIGGKIVGAGGGGFLLFYTEDRMRLRHAMTEVGLKEVRFRFDYEGAKVVVG
jgi:D-glycero-alpha-D-manno-heptose-7-phosphate kinase